MSIPYASTTITVLREPDNITTDAYDDGAPTQFSPAPGLSRIRAHIYATGGSQATNPGGTGFTSGWHLSADPVQLHVDDKVKDDRTGEIYNVEYTHTILDLIPHTTAGLEKVGQS